MALSSNHADTLHLGYLVYIVSGQQKYFQWNENPSIDLFNKIKFPLFHSCLDAEMTRLQAASLGSKKKKREPLTHEEEEILWTGCLLGSPQALVDTVLFTNGIYFALYIVGMSIGNFTPSHAEFRLLESQASIHT